MYWLYETSCYERDKEKFLGKPTAISPVCGKIKISE
jgi:hypothetical protein